MEKEPAAIWEVIGGKDKGGIMVREGRHLRSKEVAERLAFASFVEEVELVGERLHYKLMAGSGPATGWVSINIGDDWGMGILGWELMLHQRR